VFKTDELVLQNNSKSRWEVKKDQPAESFFFFVFFPGEKETKSRGGKKHYLVEGNWHVPVPEIVLNINKSSSKVNNNKE